MVTYPPDWKECSFKDTGIEVLKGQIITKANAKEGKIPVVAGGKEPAYYCDKYNRDGFTVTISASGANAGYVNLYKGRIFASDCSTISEAPNYDVRYIYYLLLNKQNEIYDAQTGGAQPHIHPKDIYKLPIVFTSDISEQQTIASVLSDFDEHIDNLTELIEKKKAIRDGALNDLISGKIRLDGFDGEWGTIPFNQYFTLLPTNTYSREQLTDSGKIGNIHYGDILINYGSVLSEKDYIPKVIDVSKINARQYLKKNDVIIADTAEDDTVGKAVQVGDISIPLVSGLHTMACRPNYPTADGFLGYYINSNCYHDQISPYVTGIKVSSISKKSIGKTELFIPVDIKEQQAISEVLTAMDEEIESLKIEKEKMLQIKEGAMDDLLIGRVRLKV